MLNLLEYIIANAIVSEWEEIIDLPDKKVPAKESSSWAAIDPLSRRKRTMPPGTVLSIIFAFLILFLSLSLLLPLFLSFPLLFLQFKKVTAKTVKERHTVSLPGSNTCVSNYFTASSAATVLCGPALPVRLVWLTDWLTEEVPGPTCGSGCGSPLLRQSEKGEKRTKAEK